MSALWQPAHCLSPHRVTSVATQLALPHMAQRRPPRQQWRRSAALLLLCVAGLITLPGPAAGQLSPPPSPSPRYGSPATRSDCACLAPACVCGPQGQKLLGGRDGEQIYLQDMLQDRLAQLTPPPVRTRPLRATCDARAAHHQGKSLCWSLGRCARRPPGLRLELCLWQLLGTFLTTAAFQATTAQSAAAEPVATAATTAEPRRNRSI